MKTCPQMKEVIAKLAEKHGVDLSQIGAHFRLDQPGYERLCVETISARRVSVAHYFEMNGDLVPDPDIVFLIDEKGSGRPLASPIPLVRGVAWSKCQWMAIALSSMIEKAKLP